MCIVKTYNWIVMFMSNFGTGVAVYGFSPLLLVAFSYKEHILSTDSF